MSASLILQAALSGLTNGFVYALIGLGIAVIFKGSRIINAMQGEFAVIGALITVFAMQAAKVPYPLAIVAGVLLGAISGWAIDVLFVRPMTRRGANEESFLLLTIGLAVTLSAATLYFGGRDTHMLPGFGGSEVMEFMGATLPYHAAWLMVIAVLVVIALRYFFTKTLVGLAMSAASADPDGATTTGINVGRMRSYTFLLGGSIGALAGILVTPLIGMNYHMGIALTLKGFAAAILGGLMNPLGAVVGGVVMGLLESLAVVGVSSGYKDVISLGILIVIMIVMPNGILGRAGRVGG